MGLFDVHAHLTHPRLRQDIDGVLERARAAGLTRVISNGLNLPDNVAVRALATKHPMVRPAFGLYPVDAVLPEMHAAGVEYPCAPDEHSAEEVAEWVADHVDEAIAVGEIGLDGYWVPEAFWDRQEAVLRTMLKVAQDADLPVILHSRKRERRTLEILLEMGVKRADFHCFSSKVKLGLRVAEAGYYLSIPANARKAQNFTALLQRAPRDRLLLETDCPFLSPDRDAMPCNEPATVAGTAAFAAELWDEPIEFVVELFEENYRRLFGEDTQ